MPATHYDIVAKSPTPVSPNQLIRVLQPLLEDRFQLKWHREKKEQPVYYLTLGEGGAKLRETAPGACVPFVHNGPPPSPIPGRPTSCDYIL